MKQICEYMAHNQICESFLLAIVTAVNCRVLQIGFAKKKHGTQPEIEHRLGRRLYVILLQVDTAAAMLRVQTSDP
jgi:hypothetical protein